MSHYFHTPHAPATRHSFSATIWGRDYTLTTARGVFSATRLDPGTAVLLRETAPPRQARRLADIGCGLGPIAVALATECPQASIDAIDVNERALELTRLNAEAAGVGAQVRTLLPDQVGDQTYDQLWSNPPIRIGKQALHALLLEWLPRLAPGGEGWFVVGKNLGADSLQRWIIDQGWRCERTASSKGFRVLRVTWPAPDSDHPQGWSPTPPNPSHATP